MKFEPKISCRPLDGAHQSPYVRIAEHAATFRHLLIVHLVGLLFLYAGELTAQSSQRLMSMPIKYINGPDGAILPDHKKDVAERELWVVASDRDGNVSYQSPGGAVKRNMQFMDLFYVAEESGEFLRLIKYDFLAKDSRNRITKAAEDWGWARKDKLLLWPGCLIDKLKISRKALPAINSSNPYDPKTYLQDDNTLVIYNNPELTKESKISTRLFQFYFVYKEAGNALLVGRTARSQSGSMKQDILGWVNIRNVIEWSGRVFLQPNNDPDAVAERKARKVTASLWATKADALAWAKKGKGPRKALWNRDTYGENWPPQRFRMPVLSEENGIIKTGFFTDLLDSMGRLKVGGR
jgi:hypothetical protein